MLLNAKFTANQHSKGILKITEQLIKNRVAPFYLGHSVLKDG